ELTLVRLEVATTPVVEDREPGDVAVGVAFQHVAALTRDDRREFALVVKLLRRRGKRHLLTGAKNTPRVREIENRQPRPHFHARPTTLACPLAGGVLFEGDVVANGRRLQNRRAEFYLVECDARCAAARQRIAQSVHCLW